MSSARLCLPRIHWGFRRNHVSSLAPRFLSVNEREGQSIRYALHVASKRFSPSTERTPGKSSVMVHGIFSIHGTDREITVPAQVETSADHWTATVHFTVPYEKWGMKNPSTLFLKVSDSVQIDLTAAGSVVPHTANSTQ